METQWCGNSTPYSLQTPHSLGKLIEWKLHNDIIEHHVTQAPHSLGKLIEWKPSLPLMMDFLAVLSLPTRWGN